MPRSLSTLPPLTLFTRLAKHQAIYIFVALGVAVALLLPAAMLEILRRAANSPDIPLSSILAMATLQIPEQIQRHLPFIAFIAAALSFSSLAASNELVAARSLGVHPFKIAAPPLIVCALLGVASFLVFDPVAAASSNNFLRMEAKLLRGQTSSLNLNENGLWLRHRRANPVDPSQPLGYAVIHAPRVHNRAKTLEDLSVFLQDPNGSFLARIDADQAQLLPGELIIPNAVYTDAKGRSKSSLSWSLPTPLTPQAIEEQLADPKTIPSWLLPSFINTAQLAGFNATPYRIRFAQLFAAPIILAAFAALAFPLASLRSRRSDRFSRFILVFLMAFGAYLLHQFALALAGVGAFSPSVAVLAAPAFAFLLYLYFHLKYEEHL